ncbi:MAG: head GIN domain-containing protein [Bacteroidia bacterium]
MKLILYLPVLALLFSSCKKENLCDCFKGTGKPGVETRDLKGFDRILMEDKMDVYFSQSPDSTFEVKIEGGSHLLKLIKAEVVGNELRLRNDNKCDFMRSYKKSGIKVHVKAPSLSYITNKSVGNFYSENTINGGMIEYDIQNSGDIILSVNCNTVSGHLHGAGDAIVSGSTLNHSVHSTGQSFVNAENLDTPFCFIYFNSSGTAKINANAEIFAKLYGSGNVYYKGNPGIITVERYGKGQLIPF